MQRKQNFSHTNCYDIRYKCSRKKEYEKPDFIAVQLTLYCSSNAVFYKCVASFIPNREIGRCSLLYQKSGDLTPNRGGETWKLCRYLVLLSCAQELIRLLSTIICNASLTQPPYYYNSTLPHCQRLHLMPLCYSQLVIPHVFISGLVLVF